MTGLHLAQYRIDAEIGRGGMGIVYRATDTKLDRTVALKVLPPHALASMDDRARFYREARAAAKLNHPHIATIHQIDEAPLITEGETPAPDAGQRPFIAMEYVDGESLADRVAKGPLKLDEAVRIAVQVAEALGAAHEAGIVHRDVKSGNVMLTAKGEVKVLDFGLAKTAASTQLTRQGATLGTIAYMSPEQARGEEVDRRTDLWAMGVVLYEMIAGRLPFQADYEQAALYGILNEDPEPLTAVRTGVSMDLEGVVFKLLRKDARLRYQTAADLVADLSAVQVGVGATGAMARTTIRPAATRSRSVGPTVWRRPAALFGLAGLLVGALLTAGVLRAGRDGRPVSSATPKRFTQSVPTRGGVLHVSISRDGSKVAYVSGVLHVLDLRTGQVAVMNELSDIVTAEFSPDGQEFLLARSQGIVRVPVTGGTPLPFIDTVEGGPRAVWGDDGYVYYEDENGVFRVSVTGKDPVQIAAPDLALGEIDMDWPSLLPGGTVLAATIERTDLPEQIVFVDIESRARLKVVDLPGRRVQWSDSGHLVFTMNDLAVAMPFDPETLQQTGPIIPVASGVNDEGLAISREGTLVDAGLYVGFATVSTSVQPILINNNEVRQLPVPDDSYGEIRLHPDGVRAVATIFASDRSRSDIWVLDLERGNRSRLTDEGQNRYPVWSSDGEHVLYLRSPRDGAEFVPVERAVDGSDFRILDSGASEPGLFDLDLSRDGEWIAYTAGIPGLQDQVTTLYVERLSDQSAVADFHDRFDNPRYPAFSPDGRYLAFQEQGAIRVLSLERPGAVPQTVWERGMGLVRWKPDGTAILATSTDGSPYVVDVRLDPAFSVASPSRKAANWPVVGSEIFDLSADGEWIVLPTTPDGSGLSPDLQDSQSTTIDLHFVVDYFGLLETSPR